MTTTTNNIKEVRAMLRSISKELGYYAESEDFQIKKARNAKDYDNAGKTMQVCFDNIMRDMNEIIHKMNVLGVSCGRMDVRDYMVIKTERISF